MTTRIKSKKAKTAMIQTCPHRRERVLEAERIKRKRER